MDARRLLVTTVLTAVLTVAPVSIFTASAHAAPAPGNTIAVCGCGKVFTPTADTKYITYEDASYACCSEGCHKMAAGNPGMAAKMAKMKTEEALAHVQTPMQVANVVEVTKDGAVAMCGCGMKVAVNDKTVYLDVKDKSYAICSTGCRDFLAAELEKAPGIIDAKVAEYQHEH